MRRTSSVGRIAGVAALLVLGVLALPVRAREDVGEIRSRFDAAVASADEGEARAAAKALLARFPDDPSALHVLRVLLEQGWKWPRFKTSLETLKRWEREEVDDRAEPDLRLALVEEIERRFPREEVVKNGGTLYERLWCHLQAKRYEEAIDLGRTFLRKYRDSLTQDKVRWAMTVAYLALSPPDTEEATALLEWLATDEASRYHKRAARKLDDLRTGSTWIPVEEGLPKAEGLGRVALVTDLPESSALLRALATWRERRDARVVRFRKGRLDDIVDDLRRLGPEFVAFAVAPQTVDVNFHWHVLEICRALDEDPMPDFAFGYLTARDGADLEALAERSLASPVHDAPRLRVVGVPASVGAVEGLDAFLHYGHGTPTAIQGGLGASALADASLSRHPVVVSGACFNGVLSRSYHASAMLPVVRRPEAYAPHDVLALAWIHAGASGVIAALEGDRGEMAGAEWAFFREAAPTLGETTLFSYRLAFTSLPETWDGFPRYRVGGPRSQALYEVMLRGLTSRILVGDPAHRPCAAPTSRAATESEAAVDEAGGLRITVRIADDAPMREAQFLFLNTLTLGGMEGSGFTERRLFARVPLPESVTEHPGRPEATVLLGGKAIDPSRVVVRHEVWGGRRWACVQIESKDGALATPGATATFRFRR